MALPFFLQQPSVLRGTLSQIISPDSRWVFWKEITQTSKQVIFESFFAGMIASALYYRVNPQTTSFVMILVGFFVTSLWFSIGKNRENDTKKDYKKKAERLDRTMKRKRNAFSKKARSLLYRNPALIKVFSNLYVFARFDKKNFKDALITSNQLIRIYESCQIGVVLPDQMIDIAEELSRNTMNHMHSMIHSLPSTTVGGFRWQVQLDFLQKILQKIVDDIKHIAKKQYQKTGPTIYNPPPDYRSGPWANPLDQAEYNPHWNQYF
jgi:hypothetical protein